ncbi:hypothetical protein NOM01_16985, partial [Sporolactobacillus sp. STSJ-5]|uniref:hypothetical protein n=1 Tax=Sporolactobacillus sp. STSJ-5 TaxID=2965076 RepID=UPI002102A691
SYFFVHFLNKGNFSAYLSDRALTLIAQPISADWNSASYDLIVISARQNDKLSLAVKKNRAKSARSLISSHV